MRLLATTLLALVLLCIVSPVYAGISTLSLSTICADGSYYDVTSLSCIACGTNMVVRATKDGSRCVCAPGVLAVYDTATPPTLTCTKCPTGSGASPDNSMCLPCQANAAGVASTYDATAGVCTCPSQNRLVSVDAGGSSLGSIACVACNDNSFLDTNDPFSCVPCPDPHMVRSNGVCVCNTTYTIGGSNDMCLQTAELNQIALAYPLTTAANVIYNDVTDDSGAQPATTVASLLFSTMFPQAATSCKYDANRTACEALGNLCVLQNYDKTSEACSAFADIADTRTQNVNAIKDWATGMPWLYYQDNAVLRSFDITSRFTFSKSDANNYNSIYEFSFLLVKYDLEGRLLGFQNLTNELQLCPNEAPSNTAYRKFGTNYINTCKFDMATVLDWDEPMLYELYFRDTASTLYPVPIRVQNYRDNGRKVNVNVATNDAFGNYITRRFYLYDNVSGRRVAGSPPEIVRLAQTITLTVALQESASSFIYPPVIDILYAERKLQSLQSETSSLRFPTLTFESVYTMTLTNFWRTMTGLFIFAIVVAVVFGFFRFFTWVKRNQSGNIDGLALIRMLLKIVGMLSTWFFILIFCISLYWMIFFKWQATVFVLLPAASEYTPFIAVLVTAFIAQLLHVGQLIYTQCKADIFFIDWEQSRGKLIPKTGEASKAKDASISIWRTLFVANEFAEDQVLRQIDLNFTLFALLLLLDGAGLQYLATPQPSFTDLTEGPTNMVLRFCVTSSLWLLLALFQMIFNYVIAYRYFGNPLEHFVDFISLANVSCFILHERYAGYYLHGRSVHPFADVDMAEMTSFLKAEAEGKVQQRGLEGTEEQAFEIFITPELRQTFDSCYGSMLTASQGIAAQRLGQSSALIQAGANEYTNAYHKLNGLLCTFIDGTHPVHKKVRQTRTRVDTFMENQPPMHDVPAKSVFCPVPEGSYGKVNFHGVEWDLLLFDILFYAVMDLATGQTYAAILLTFVMDYIRRQVRMYFGTANLVRKSLVDDRFLS